MKICFKCAEELPLAEFYKHKGMADGHLGKCKTCTKEDVIANRLANVEYYRQYDRTRGNRQTQAYHDNYNAEYPDKYKARYMVKNGIRDGKLSKPVLCQFCGSYSKLHGHHCNYDKPLDVRWLCVPCHSHWHSTYG